MDGTTRGSPRPSCSHGPTRPPPWVPSPRLGSQPCRQEAKPLLTPGDPRPVGETELQESADKLV